MGIVFGEIGVQDSSSLLHKKCSLFTIDELSDIFLCFGCRNKREPNWFGFAIAVCDDLDTLTIVEYIIKWYNSAIDLGYGDCIAEVGVDRICEIDRSRSFGQRHDISTRCEYEYLILEDIHLHIIHELTSALIYINNSLDRLYPIAIFGFVTVTCF